MHSITGQNVNLNRNMGKTCLVFRLHYMPTCFYAKTLPAAATEEGDTSLSLCGADMQNGGKTSGFEKHDSTSKSHTRTTRSVLRCIILCDRVIFMFANASYLVC